MLSIAVCDDNETHLHYTCAFIAQTQIGRDALMEGYTNGKALLLALENREFSPDIAILDILLADTDGVALAKEINALSPHCQIIFLTSHLGYATQVL